MPENVSFKFAGDHLVVTLADGYEFDPAASEQLWAELARLCKENETCRVLVEGRAPEVEPETPEVIASGQRAATVPKLWLAFHFADFVPTPKSDVFEAIAGSKGVRVRHFADRDQALKWLRSNAPS